MIIFYRKEQPMKTFQITLLIIIAAFSNILPQDVWEKTTGLDSIIIYSLAINSNGDVFAGTADGVFRSLYTTSIKESENEIVSSFLLYQNYPNPFNPSTLISYSIPQSGFVTLKVYDLLGNEVATLVNENELAERYEVEFNASKLSSGIYLYKLQAGSFVQTRKMILLK